ncbi:MAG: sulfotransferase family protein [Candidatus Heimdallarchaeota archaeon]|nr:sulfotransferase family protein [Candidatus Heimdallarchaeota archaeon]
MITIVSGLPRSGTSMMMSMLEAGGLKLLVDNERKADDDNPKGYFEWERVKKLPEGDISWVEKAEGKVVKAVSYFLNHFPPNFEYQVIFMERSYDEILKSQKVMMERRGEEAKRREDKTMAEYFKSHIKKTKEWLSLQPNFYVIYVSYKQVLENPTEYAQKINEFLEAELKEDKMVKVVDGKLYRQRSKN